MDYVRESLMRQQTVLAWMLLGAAEIPGEVEALSGAQRSPGISGGDWQGADGGTSLKSAAGADAPAPLLWTEASQRRQAALRQAEEARAARMVDLAASAAAAAVGLRPHSGGTEAVAPARGAAAFDERGPGAAGRGWTGLPEAVRSRAGGAEAWQTPAAGGDLFAGGDVPGGAARSVAEVVIPRPAGRADPAALSRTFQRDARRYDGGFELY